jgi:hypothetical protein
MRVEPPDEGKTREFRGFGRHRCYATVKIGIAKANRHAVKRIFS